MATENLTGGNWKLNKCLYPPRRGSGVAENLASCFLNESRLPISLWKTSEKAVLRFERRRTREDERTVGVGLRGVSYPPLRRKPNKPPPLSLSLSQLSPLLSPHQWRPPLRDASLLRGFLCSLVSQVNTCMGPKGGRGGRKRFLSRTVSPSFLFNLIIRRAVIQQVGAPGKKKNPRIDLSFLEQTY